MVAALIAANIVVYIWEQHTASHVVARFGMWPYAVHTRHEWYRLITAAFLHANLQHIFFNMATLAIIGPPVEAELGKARFGGLYLAAALGGSVGSYLLSPASELGVGASGAIFGLMGAYFVLARRRGWDTSMIVGLILINLLIGFTGNIDWRAHIGGLLTGSVVAFGLGAVAGARRSTGRVVEALAGGAVVAAAVGVLALLVQIPPGQVNL